MFPARVTSNVGRRRKKSKSPVAKPQGSRNSWKRKTSRKTTAGILQSQRDAQRHESRELLLTDTAPCDADNLCCLRNWIANATDCRALIGRNARSIDSIWTSCQLHEQMP